MKHLTTGLITALLTLLSGCAEPLPQTAQPSTDVMSTDAGPVACSATIEPLVSKRLTRKGTSFLDASGRQVLLRGVNTGGRNKFAPFFPFAFSESGLTNQRNAPPFSQAVKEYFDQVADWGHNVVRMPFSWEALEPTRGSYDDVYLERYLALIDAADDRNILVIVDFHQDVFAAPYCGDGFPLWTCPEPVPTAPEDCSGWFMGYLEQASPIHEAYGRFWRNEDGLMDAFKDMWKHMAKAAWTRDNVIGFEIINEPHHGTQDEDTWAKEELPDFYEALSAEIRTVAPDALIFFDSTGLDAATQDPLMAKPAGDEFIFAPHYYLMSIYTGGELDMEEIPKGLKRWSDKGQDWNLPVLVGEFGIYRALPEAEQYFTVIMDSLDKHLLSGTAWEFSTTIDDWNDEGMSLVHPDGRESQGLQALIRPYPSAVAGQTISFEYDTTNGQAQLVFDATKNGRTEIVVPTRLFDTGLDVSITGGASCYEHMSESSRLIIHATQQSRLTVVITPKG